MTKNKIEEKMKTLNKIYRKRILEVATLLKVNKPKLRRQASLASRKLMQTEEYQILAKETQGFNLSSSKYKARLLYLAYAVARNKDPKTVEKYFLSIEDYTGLQTLIKEIEAESLKAEVANV